jgi:hypothetical protein
VSARRAAAALTSVVAAAALACLAGCGGAPAVRHTGLAAHSSAAGLAGAVRLVGPLAGSKSLARGYGLHLLSGVVVPASATLLPAQQLPSLAPGQFTKSPDEVDPHRLYRLPMTMAALQAFLSAHPPADMSASPGGGTVANRGSTVIQYLTWSPRSMPAGIFSAQLEGTIGSGSGGTALLAVDAQVIWYPPRTLAENFAAADFRSVTFAGATATGAGVQRTYTSPRVIAELVQLLDGMHGNAWEPVSCPNYEPVSAALAAAPGRPAVRVQLDGCGIYSVFVGGKAQPNLWTPDERLYGLLVRLS